MSGILRNVGSNWVVNLGTMVVAYVLTPFLIRVLGNEGYGVWMLIMSITGYLGLLILGVPMASVRYLAEDVAEGDRQKVNETIGSCLGLYGFMGAAALIVGAGLLVFFFRRYGIPPAWEIDGRLAFGVVVLYVSIGFVGILPEGIMMAHHDFVVRNIVVLSVLVLRVVLTLVLLSSVPSLALLACIQVGCLTVDFWTSWFLIRRRYNGVRISLKDFDRAVVRRIFSFSLFVLMLNLGGLLSFQTDSMVIGAFLDVNQIPFYTVANSFLVYLIGFIAAIASVLMPIATKLKTEGKTDGLKEIFLKWSKISFSLTLLPGLFLLVLGPRFIAWWISPTFERPAGVVLQILMLSGLVFLPVRAVVQPILMGLGRVGVPTFAFLGAGVLNLALSVVLVKRLGLAGVAIGTAIPTALVSLVMLVFACVVLGISLLAYARYVILRASLGAMPLLALLLWFRFECEVQSLTGLVGSGVAAGLFFALIWVFFVYRNDPYVQLSGRLRRLWRGA
jgi:O-antigen/teichoic acid export membrane protein